MSEGNQPAPAPTTGTMLYPANAPAQPAPVIDPATGQPMAAPIPPDAAKPTDAIAEPAKADDATKDPVKDPVVEPPKADDAKPEDAKPVVPDKYEIKLPEGMELSEPLMTKFQAEAKAAGLSNEAAQKMMDLYTEAATQAQTSAATAFNETQSKWVTEIKAMPEFQGEAYERNVATLGKMMDEFGSPEARDALNMTGAGNNPAIVKYLLNLANVLTEGTPTTQGNPTGGPRQPRSLGQRLYPEKAA